MSKNSDDCVESVAARLLAGWQPRTARPTPTWRRYNASGPRAGTYDRVVMTLDEQKVIARLRNIDGDGRG